jgi:VRR-NUC domain
MKQMARRPEQEIQKAIFQHLALRGVPDVFAFHVPNGGWRSRVEAAILKSMGGVAGVPDVILIRDSEMYALEIKAEGGRLSPAQRECQGRMRAAGVKVVTAVGLDQALEQLEAWQLLRGSAGAQRAGEPAYGDGGLGHKPAMAGAHGPRTARAR